MLWVLRSPSNTSTVTLVDEREGTGDAALNGNNNVDMENGILD